MGHAITQCRQRDTTSGALCAQYRDGDAADIAPGLLALAKFLEANSPMLRRNLPEIERPVPLLQVLSLIQSSPQFPIIQHRQEIASRIGWDALFTQCRQRDGKPSPMGQRSGKPAWFCFAISGKTFKLVFLLPESRQQRRQWDGADVVQW